MIFPDSSLWQVNPSSGWVKAKGIKLGRPKGPGKSKLDKFNDEIVALLKKWINKIIRSKEIWNNLAQSL